MGVMLSAGGSFRWLRDTLRRVTSGLKDSVEIMKEKNLPGGKNFIISGDCGKSKFWCQIMADIFNKKITRLSSEEGPCYGAAILAGVGTGIFKEVKSACKKFLIETEVFKPEAKNVKIYKSYYEIYKKLYKSLKDDFKILSEIRGGG